MRKKFEFMALGGGQNVGASCYYVNIANNKILLDCGKRIDNGLEYGPDFSNLLNSGEISSESQLNAIFISHAHYDHIGYLPVLLANNTDIPVYTTYITKKIGQHIMFDGKKIRPAEEIRLSNMIYSINEYGYCQKFHLNNMDVTFFEAGHIPGAAMIYFETEDGNILYTGDFSMHSTALTGKCVIPDNIKPDTVIMCAVHAKHPEYVIKNKINYVVAKTALSIKNRQSVYLKVSQLTKGNEFIDIMNKAIDEGKIPECTIFYDYKIKNLSSSFNEINLQTFSSRCREYTQNTRDFGIYIGSYTPRIYPKICINADFSLHSDYGEICSLIEKLQPKKLVVVHTGTSRELEDNCVLERKYDNITVYYPENGEFYLI